MYPTNIYWVFNISVSQCEWKQMSAAPVRKTGLEAQYYLKRAGPQEWERYKGTGGQAAHLFMYFYFILYYLFMPGENVNPVLHFHKLCNRVSHSWGSLRGQHIWSVIDTPGPEKTVFVTMFSSLSGKSTYLFLSGGRRKVEGVIRESLTLFSRLKEWVELSPKVKSELGSSPAEGPHIKKWSLMLGITLLFKFVFLFKKCE